MGELIRFPIERRQQQVTGGTQVSVSASPGMNVTITKATGVAGSAAAWHPPEWWALVPTITGKESADARGLWMKLGASPKLRAKRHRVIAIQQDEHAGEAVLVAVAACGRRSILSRLFNDPWSGGDCEGCRKRGWR